MRGVAGILLAALAAALLAGAALRREAPQVEFLAQALGEPAAASSLTRRPDGETRVELRRGGYALERGAVSVGLESTAAADTELRLFENGASRRTPYGWEAVTVDGGRTEQFLTVLERQGPTTWRWELETLELTPRVGDDGAVGFIRQGRLLSDVAFIEPVRILDEDGVDVTPAAARWSLVENGGRWFLELPLDDGELPLPYVIDPAIAARGGQQSANTGGGANTITITKPTGIVAGDLLVAQVTARGGTGTAICPPSATGTWTSADRRDSTTTLAQQVFWKQAVAADVAAASFAFGLRAATCAGALTSLKASGGMVAFVDTANQANPIDGANGDAFASAATVSPPAVTPTVADTRVAGFYGIATGGTAAANWSTITYELWDQSSTTNGAATRTSSAAGHVAGGAAGVAVTPATGTAASGAGVNIGQTLAIAPLAADGSGTLTTPTANVTSQSSGHTVTFTYTVATGGMRNGSVTLTVPAGWTAPSTAGASAGHTISSAGTVGVAGQTITVSGITLTASSTFTITYGSKASGGPGATAPGAAGAQAWPAQQRSSTTSGAFAALAASPSITVDPGPGTQLALSGSTADLTSGATRLLTATIRDAYGNTVTSDNSTVVAFAQQAGAGTVTGTGTATASAGVATKTITGALVGAATMEATTSGLTSGTLGAFTIVHGAAAQLALTGSTAALASGADRVVTATIRDAAGNTVTSDNSTVVTFAKASGAGTVTGTGTATATSGVATKTVTGALAGSASMEATSTGLTTGSLGAFTVVHGAAAQIELTGSTADLTSGADRVLTATIQDAAGNTVTSDSSTVVAFAKASGAGTVAGTGNATAANGLATKTIAGQLAGEVTMEATSAGLSAGALGAFTVVHGAATHIGLTHSGSTASGDTHTLTATLEDAAGNTATGDSSTVVTFGQTAGAGTVTGLGSATASSGVATKIVTNATSGQVDLDAQAAGLTSGTATYTIGAGTASTATSTIAASPTSLVADGSSTTAITVRLKDAAGNDVAVSGGTVALSLVGGGSVSAVTDNGDGTYSATLTSPTAVGSATVSGTLNAAALAATAGVAYTHGPAARVVLTESGSTQAGDAHALTATIEDANGNTVTSDSSTVVTFAQIGGAGTVTGLGSATAATGVATRNVTNMLAGSIDLEAQALGLATGTASYAVSTGPVSAAASDSTIAAAPGTVYANGSDSASITVTLRDVGGNPVPGKTVTLAQGAGSSTIAGGGSTDAAGVVTFSASSSTVETVTYTATDTTDAITLADDASVAFTFSDGTPPTNTITLGSPSGALLAGSTLYYNGATGGSFTLASAVADGGAGPASATYPAVGRAGWTHGPETVSAPAGGPYLSSAFTFAAGSSGSFTYDVNASDAWSPPNTSGTTLNVTEDSTAPTATILCEGAMCPSGSFTTAPVTVTLAASDAGAGLEEIRYTTDGSTPTILSGAVYAGAFAVASEGVTNVKYRAFDRIGNDTGVQTQTIRVDTVAPDTTIDSAPAAATQDTTPTFGFSSTEAGAAFEARLDGGAWTTATSPFTLGSLVEGTYTFEARSVDSAGNVDATPASFVFTVDATPADTTITSSPPAAAGSTTASFSFTATDAGPGFECRLDGGAFADCSSPASYAGLSEAAHTFEVRAEDAAGNVDGTPASHVWNVDLTAPETSFLSTPASPSASTTPPFGLGSSESPSTFECNLDGSGWSACTTPYTSPALADGSHTLKVRALDAAGNTDASEATHSWVVDATAPTGALTAPAAGSNVGGTIVLASDSADGGSGVATVAFQRSPASVGGWTSEAASWDTTQQPDGDYDLRVITTDAAGNSFTSPVVTVTVDNTDPTLSVLAPNPVNLTTTDPASVAAIATDTGSGVANVRFDQCAEDSAACLSDSWVPLAVDTAAPYAASWPIPSDGPRLLRVRATDNAGKQKTELVLVTIDRIRPTGALTAPAAGANLHGSVALAATAADTSPGTVNSVTFQSSPAGAGTWTDAVVDSAAPYAGTLDTTSLADGLYDLRVFTTDGAGNAEAAPATIQVRVDNTTPTGAVTAPAAGADARGTITLTSSSADGGSGVATVQFQRSPTGAGSWTDQASSFDTTAVADGEYDLRVVTTDNAGNTFTSGTITIRIDNTNPTGAVTGPAAGANARGTITLSSSSADGGSGVALVQFQRSPTGAGAWTNGASSFDTTAVADGEYDLRVVTTDNAGNTFTSGTITIRVDNTNPSGAVTAPADSAEIGVAPVGLTSNSADAGSGVAAVVFERSPAGAGTWTATPATWDTATGTDAVADGSYDLRVRTTDNAGNVFTSAVVTVLVDHTAPTTSASPAPGSPSNAPVTVSFSADDGTGSGISVVSYRVDGGSLQAGAAVVIPAPGDHTNDGAHLVEFFSTDEVGNVEALKSTTVVIDTTAPSGSGGNPGDYLRGIANLTYSTSATDVSAVQFEFSPAGAGAWSAIGGADVAPPYEAAWNTSAVADGPYDLRAVVTDSTGNVANTLLPGLPKTVDNSAPSGSVTAPLPNAFVSGSISVDANGSDGAVPPASGVSAVRFEVKPSGAAAFSVFGTQTAPVVGSTYRQALATTSLADGPAELRVVVTDVGGNETTSAAATVNVDNDAPVVTLGDPGAAAGANLELSATSSADTATVTFRYRPVGSGAAGTLIGSDSTAPFGITWATAPAAEQQWELIAVAADGGGNVTTSSPRLVLVDRTQPTGAVIAPAAAAVVGGPAVALAASAADTAGSGVKLVEWQVKEFGAGTFTTVASDGSAPYTGSWNSTTAPDGATEIRALVTDAAGNVRATATVSVTVDSTGPSVTLTHPGAVLSGTVTLGATAAGVAARVRFSVSPADTGTWTEIAEDTSAPFSAAFDTASLADGLYDVRAIGFDSLGNQSAASVHEDVRLDNTAPELISSTPADGSLSPSAAQIVLTASEPVTGVGTLLDGAAAPAPTVSGNQLTFATGALADGLHVLEGALEDASGTRVHFRVAVTIEATPSSDTPAIERSITSSGDWTLPVPGGLVTIRMPRAAWPAPPTPQDHILVLRVDAGPAGADFAPGSQIVDVTARWALAGTSVTDFDAPIEIVFSNPAGASVLPAVSADGITWRTVPPLHGPLQAAEPDGFSRAGSDVHVWTRHLTFFGLRLDGAAPTEPTGFAGVVAEDGLTLRWIPGTDSSGQLGNVVLYVNGEGYREFGPTEFEGKLGAFAAGDTRTFTLAQKDAAGNISRQTAPLRALPQLAGSSLEAATAALGAAGFAVGTVRERATNVVPPGTVLEPSGVQLALAATPIDLVIARGTAAPETRLVFAVAGPKRVSLGKQTTLATRLTVSKPASVTATMRNSTKRPLFSWQLSVKAGSNVVKLRLPKGIRRPGTYTVTWVARAGTETVSRTVKVALVAPKAAQAPPKRDDMEIVLAGEIPAADRLEPSRVVSAGGADETFKLVSSSRHALSLVVVDGDAYGTRFIADLRTVFPEVRVIAISREPARRALALRAGAIRALPRTVTAKGLAKAIAAASDR